MLENGININLSGDDVYSDAIPIGFTFNFYGNDYTECYIDSNGFICFGNIFGYDYFNQNIPFASTANDPNNYIAVFWDDLEANNNIFYEQKNNRFYIEFQNYQFVNSDILGTFQVVLEKDTNKIFFYYLELITNNTSSCTIGIENIDSTEGVKYSYNTPNILTEGQIISFTPDSSGGYIMDSNDTLPTTPSNPTIPIEPSGFTFNGIHSDSFNLFCDLTVFPIVPEIRKNEIIIPGKNGVLDFTDGTIEDCYIEFECGFESSTKREMITKAIEIGQWLRSNARKDLILDYCPDYTFKAILNNKIDLEQVILALGKFTISFKCDPPAYFT